MSFLLIIFIIKAIFTWLYEFRITDADLKEADQELSFDIQPGLHPTEFISRN